MEPYDKGLTRFIIDKSYSFFQKAVNSGTSREGPVFSAECTIGMVRGLTPLKHYGAMALWHYGTMALWQ